jgi:hypothetical protein
MKKEVSKIKTFEDACNLLNRPATLPDVSALPEGIGQYLIAEYKIVTIVEALNKEANNGQPWQPDWNNQKQYKYYPWFWVSASDEKPAGFGFSGSDYDNASSNTFVGSRLCFLSAELALYAGEQFKDLYQQKLLIS